MTQAELVHFRELLIERRHNINSWLETASGLPETELQKARRLLGQIVEALQKVEEGAYGLCRECHDPIELHRLEIQPVTQVCLGCISAKEKEQLEQELYLASKIHRALLPQSVSHIEGFEIAVRSLAARYVGGDYYDFLSRTESGMSRIVIADAMGKGIPAALLMSNVQGALRILSEEISSPAQLVARLNSWLCRNVPITKFVSLVCLGIAAGTQPDVRLVYANAGHCPPLIVRVNGKVEELESTGGILGVHPQFDYSEGECTLRSGDLLILYTDGVVECEDDTGEMFAEERLMSFLSSHRSQEPQQLVNGLIEQVISFAGKLDATDDMTVIALKKI